MNERKKGSKRPKSAARKGGYFGPMREAWKQLVREKGQIVLFDRGGRPQLGLLLSQSDTDREGGEAVGELLD